MTVDRSQIAPLAGVMFLAMVPHLFRLPWWITAPAVLCWGYAGFGSRRGWRWPGRRLLTAMAAACFALAVISFGTAMGSEAGVGLLGLMTGLKIFETRAYRDRMVALFLTYFLIITTVLLSETLLTTFYMLFCVFVTTALLIGFQHRTGRMKNHLKLAGKIFLQALPLAVVLFFLFPRIQGSFWGIQDPSRGLTGFSDAMSPGSVSNLAQSTEIAFRVNFEGNMPPPRRLYWRGIVFWKFDGRTWHPFHQVPPLHPLQPGKGVLSYNIAMAPHGHRWLFSLDFAGTTPPGSVLMADHTISTVRRIRSTVQYRLTSYQQYAAGAMRAWETVSLQLPDSGNPMARELAREIQARAGGDPVKIVQHALDFFRENQFVYTLEPPLLGEDSVDEFLFDTRSGYCEHYAGAFAFLLRAAKVPARVVGGYLGGEVNPYGRYLIVRQSDAHAWVEARIDETGWTRVDPTSAVAPQRVEIGMAAALPLEEIPRVMPFFVPGALHDLLRRSGLVWDAANNGWNQWVMGYSAIRQRYVLRKMGIGARSWKAPAIGAMLGMLICGLLIFGYVYRFRAFPPGHSDPAARVYDRYCRKLAGAGIPRPPHLGPLDYAARVIGKRGDLREPVTDITARYVRLRYAQQGGRKDLQKLVRLVRRFRP